MKNIILVIILFITGVSCKAQTTISLEQAYQYSKSDDGIPETVTYIKDINNRLDQFVGTWKGSYNGKNYEFKFIKKLNYTKYTVKWDKLIGRILIKDSNGNIIYNTMNESDDNTMFWGYQLQTRAYVMSFVYNSYCNDSGDIFIEVRKNNSNEMTLYFYKDGGLYNPAKCPNYDTYVPLLPKDKIVLTKQ